MNKTVYLKTYSGYELLYANEEKKVFQFLRYWASFRPLSEIQVRYLNSMDGVTVEYTGNAFTYVDSRKKGKA